MDVEIAGERRSWRPRAARINECAACGSRSFRQSRIGKHWYCKGCNEGYQDEPPWFAVVRCSKHGDQPQQGPEGYWCADCEDDDWQAVNGALYHAQDPAAQTRCSPTAINSPHRLHTLQCSPCNATVRRNPSPWPSVEGRLQLAMAYSDLIETYGEDAVNECHATFCGVWTGRSPLK